MKTILRNAMIKTTHRYPDFCWWSDFWTNQVINYGVKMGWFWRISTTQCGWTEAGVAYMREEIKL